MLDYQGTGMSVMEMSHRSAAYDKNYQKMLSRIERFDGRSGQLQSIVPSGRRFPQQFAMIPMNLMKNGVADYIVTASGQRKLIMRFANMEKRVKIASSVG